MKTRPVMFLLLALLAVTAPVRADLSDAQRRTILAEGQAAYDEAVAVVRTDVEAAHEGFQEAAARFQQLVDDGVVNGGLYYNLGNAYLQAGDLGRAILNYRAAERLRPADPRLAHNLEHARSLRRSNIAPSGERALGRALLGWHDRLTTGRRFAIFALAFALFWAALAARLLQPAPMWPWLAGVCGLVSIAGGVSVALDLLGDDAARSGVVLVDDVVVRKGNGEGFDRQFEEPLHEGVEFDVLDRRPGWLRIELPDGKTGWISSEQAGLIGGR